MIRKKIDVPADTGLFIESLFLFPAVVIGFYFIVQNNVNDFDLSTSFGQGTDTHDVNEVWVYSSQDELGVFSLPATIPYLDVDGNGTVDITILAGIKANGIAATRTPYNLYEAMSLEEEFEAGDTTVIETFDTQYLNSAQFILCEDFESTNIFNSNFISSADIVRTTDDEYVLDGDGSGLILLNDSMNQANETHTNPFSTQIHILAQMRDSYL